MGYGFKDSNRRWPHVVYYGGTPNATLRAAMDVWARELGFLSFAAAGAGHPAQFEVSMQKSGGGWESGDKLNGRAPGKIGRLSVGDEEPIGVSLHELGHLLGLGHEQDRQDCQEAKAWCDARVKLEARYEFMLIAVRGKDQHYRNVGKYNPESIMLYGSGYEKKAAISRGDADAVKEIHGVA